MTCRRPGGLGLQEDGESEAEAHRHDEGRRDTGDEVGADREGTLTDEDPQETDRERISRRYLRLHGSTVRHGYYRRVHDAITTGEQRRETVG